MTQAASNGMVKFHRDVVLRSQGLLEMLYLPSELENELNGVVFERGKRYGVRLERNQQDDARMVKSVHRKAKVVDETEIMRWLELGLPGYSVDNRVFINGLELKDWIEAHKTTRGNKTKVGVYDGFCPTCKSCVKPSQSFENSLGSDLVDKKSACTNCSGDGLRGGRND